MLNGENSISIQNKINSFCASVNSGYQMDFAKNYSIIGDHELYGGKHAGSKAEHEGSRIIAEELIRLGLKNVEQTWLLQIFKLDWCRCECRCVPDRESISIHGSTTPFDFCLLNIRPYRFSFPINRSTSQSSKAGKSFH